MVSIPGGAFTMGSERPALRWQGGLEAVELQPYCIDVYEYPNQEGALPRMLVEWVGADALCRAAGKRLCTSAEWERACRGPEGRLYVYGIERDPTACNTPIEGSGPGVGGLPLAPSGSFPRCVTPEGVFDLNGNLSEWVADPWSGPAEAYQPHVPTDPATWRTLRGGTMWSQAFYGQSCLSRHGHPMQGRTHNDDGFRCCQSP